jgi:hypothetical protein
VIDRHLCFGIHAVAVRINPGLPRFPGLRIEVWRVQRRVILPDFDQPPVKADKRLPGPIVQIRPVQRTCQHTLPRASVVFWYPVVLAELLGVLDHRRPRTGEESDRIGLGLLPAQCSGILSCACLPIDVRVIAIAEIDGRYVFRGSEASDPGFRVTIAALYSLRETMHAALGQAGLQGKASHTL